MNRQRLDLDDLPPEVSDALKRFLTSLHRRTGTRWHVARVNTASRHYRTLIFPDRACISIRTAESEAMGPVYIVPAGDRARADCAAHQS